MDRAESVDIRHWSPPPSPSAKLDPDFVHLWKVLLIYLLPSLFSDHVLHLVFLWVLFSSLLFTYYLDFLLNCIINRVFSHYILMACMFPKLLSDLFNWKKICGEAKSQVFKIELFFFISDTYLVHLTIYIRLYGILDKFWLLISFIVYSRTSGNFFVFTMQMLRLHFDQMHWRETCKHLLKKPLVLCLILHTLILVGEEFIKSGSVFCVKE